MNSEVAKPGFLTAGRLKAVGRWALFWLVMWLGLSAVSQAFFLKDLLFLPLVLVDMASPLPVEAGHWAYPVMLLSIWTFPYGYAAKPNWEFLLLAFAWPVVFGLFELPVGDGMKGSALAGFSLWAFWANARLLRELKGRGAAKVAA